MHPVLRLGLLLTRLLQVDGRKKFQKLVYILQSMGAPFPERFSFCLYGVYSSDLRAEVQAFSEEGLLKEEQLETRTYATIKLTPAPKLTHLLKGYSTSSADFWLKWAEDLNKRSAQDLEGISTIIYLARLDWPIEQWEPIFANLKPRLSQRFEEYREGAERCIRIAAQQNKRSRHKTVRTA